MPCCPGMAISGPQEVYAGLLAHELRTPAAAMQMAAQILARDGVLDDPIKRREWIEMVGMAAERLARTVTELTEFSAINGAGASSNVPGAAATLPQIVSELAQGRPLVVEVSASAEAFPVDVGRLRLILQALLDNAYRFGAPGQPVQVHGLIADDPTRLVIRVANEGNPVPDEARAEIFEPFVQGEQGRARSHQGLGLGLTIARRAAEGAGGSLMLEQGLPTTLRLELPLFEDGLTQYLRDQADLANQQALRAVEDWRTQKTVQRLDKRLKVPSATLTSEPLRVLLVADDDAQAEMIHRAIAGSRIHRFEVGHAPNEREALRQAVIGVYDALVVVDSGLTETDGETLLERLKAIGVRAPALVLTATAGEQTISGAEDSLPGAEALKGNSLVRAILAMVRRHDLTEQVATANEQATRATSVVAELAHDLATPLGVAMGMTQVLLRDDNGLNADVRSSLDDVAQAALQACEILERLNQIEPAASALPDATDKVARVARAAASGPGAKMVLIADDDPATRRLVCAALISDEYRVVEAADGREAWQLIREHHPAVAILDWQMPVYSGLELADVIKSDAQLRSTTVIMLTGRSTPADREAGARARADLYLIKPFSPQELLGAVEHAMGIN